jgi:hypothetical protein
MQSAREFLKGAIDYAGLFPPASLDMHEAVSAYDKYFRGDDNDLLGRFILPVDKLGQFEDAFLAIRSDSPWRLSIIAGDDLDHAAATARNFNERLAGRAVVDTIETPAASAERIASAGRLADEFTVFLELPLADPAELISAVALTPASAKMRTGGIVATAIPAAEAVLTFIECCHEAGVSFKATAGLHHLVRGEYDLTYDKGAARAPMFGYLNVFLATAFSMQYDHDIALGVLTESDPRSFRFDDAGVHWQNHGVWWPTLEMVRDYVIKSFGSCSFDEPVTEAKAASII